MANKITCTCGHSWDKSDSSKKDAMVCHICGKDNTMKNGGWLDKFEAPQAQNGIEGTMGGLTDEGFNYNGAWGGPSMQNGGDLIFLEPTSRKLPKGYLIPYADSSTELATSIGGEDGEPAYLVPSFKYAKRVEDPAAEFRRTGEHLGGPFKTYQEADEWERDVRHPYVEKGQSIPTPLKRWGKDFAMGGSLPGSVGFTYARTQGSAPANGKFTKKTMASAQDGEKVEYKELPEITVVGSKDKQTRDFYNNLIDKFSENEFTSGENPFVDARVMGQYLGIMNMGKKYGFPKVKPETKSGIYKNAKGHYNPLTKTIYANDVPTWVGEMAHHVQMKDNIVSKGLQWLGNDLVEYIKQPIVSIKGEEIPNPYKKAGTVEHEAHSIIQPMLEEKAMQDYEKYRDSELARSREKRFLFENRYLQNGGEMKFYQEGLDWKPRNISRDGAWLDKYEDAPEAQDGTYVKQPRTDMLTMDEYRVQKAKQSTVTKAEPKQTAVSKALAIAVNPMTALSYKLKGQNIPENFERGERNILDYAVDIFNPASMAESISSIPKNISEGEFSQAGLNILSVLPYGMEAVKLPIIKKASSIVRDIPRAESIKEAIGRVAGVPLKKDLPRMATQDVTSLRKVQELGRMRDLNKSTSEQMKYALDNNLPEEHFNKFFRKSREEAQNLLNTGYQEQEAARSADIRSRLNLERPSSRPQAIDMGPEELTQGELTRGQQNLLDALFGEEEIDDLVDLDEIDQLEGFGEDIINPPTQNTAGRLSEAELRARFRQLDAAEAASVSPIASGSNRDLIISEILDARSRGVRPNEETMRQILTPEQFAAAERNPGGRSVPLSELSVDQLDELRNYTLSLDADDYSRIPTNFGNTLITKGKDVVRGISQGARSLDKKLENILINTIQDYPYYSGAVQQKVPGLFLEGKRNLKDVSKTVGFAPEGIKSGQVFTGSTNTSHSSYLPQLKQVFKYNTGQPQFLGYKSMNSLGYLSQAGYDEKDIAAYLNSEIDEQVKRGIIPKNIQRPFQQGKSVILPQYGVKQYKKGGIVKDDNGYWNPENWGEPVEIGSNNITMQGVNQPLIGVSDKGDVQYMEPGKDYKFKGKKVTEYPVSKKWLDKYN